MTSPANAGPGRIPTDRLNLEFPRSLAVYDTYEDAQRAVDYLSDHEFPVQNVMIVGTDLRQVERVTGRLTWGKIIAGGLLSGMWLGLFVGLIMSMFGGEGTLQTFSFALLVGAVFGIIWAGLGYSFTRGKRDFTSVSQVVATRYEVLVEHGHYDEGREVLGGLPGGRPLPRSEPTGPRRPNPYEGRYGVKTDGSAAGERPGDGGPAERERPNPYEGRYGVKTDGSDAAAARPGERDESSATAAPEPGPRGEDGRDAPREPRD